MVNLWEKVLGERELKELHRDFNHPGRYIDLIRYVGEISGRREQARDLAAFLEDRLNFIKEGSRRAKERPRVYYAMSHPLFAFKGERLENKLVELAGGESLNRGLDLKGRPGQSLSREVFNSLNPEVIFISSFISAPVDRFYQECQEQLLEGVALREKRIYTHPAPGWDFGSPRWILGLMHMANLLHPSLFDFDVFREAQEFYRRYYGLDFEPGTINRSFSKPDIRWRW